MDSRSQTREQLTAAMYQAYESQALPRVIELGLLALQHDQADETTELLLAVALQAQGRLEEALEGFRRMTRRWPGHPGHWNNLGVLARQTGDADTAEQAFLQALQLQPADWELHYNLGLLYLECRRLLEARQHLLQAADACDDLEVQLQAAHACYLCGDAQQQTRLLSQAEHWPPQPVEAALLLASMLGTEGRSRLALDVLARAAELAPDPQGQLRLQIQRAAVLERSNALAAAREELAKIRAQCALAYAPASAQVAAELARLEAAIALRDHDHRTAIHHYRLAAEHQPNGADAAIEFGLARSYDRLGETRLALVHAGRAHAAQTAQAATLVPELLQPGAQPLLLAQATVSASEHRLWHPAPPADRPPPVFIVGFPRSGTTLLEQMLDAHPDYQSMDERPFIHELTHRMEIAGQPYPSALGELSDDEIEQLRAVYWNMVERTAGLAPGRRLVDKNPLNMLALPMIMRLFPDASLILCLRHPLDILLSCYLQTFRSPAFMLMCADMGSLARAFRQAFEQWFDQVAVLKPQVLTWRYETVVRDFPGQCLALADFLRIRDASPMADFATHAQGKGYISTPSYAQVTEGIYQRGIGRWEAYRELFEPVLELLAPLIDRLGYAL